VFNDVAQADGAVVRLLNVGFTKDEIVVVAPRALQEHFHGLHATQPGGDHAARVATALGAAGGIVGGIIAAAVLIGTGGGALVIAGPLVAAAAGGAVTGGFIGAMLSRGYDKEAALYYDQAIRKGKILVGVQYEGADQRQRLAAAERALADAGAEPVPLREG
jgi:hypothetical protein